MATGMMRLKAELAPAGPCGPMGPVGPAGPTAPDCPAAPVAPGGPATPWLAHSVDFSEGVHESVESTMRTAPVALRTQAEMTSGPCAKP
jgi:hypothetical protein